MTTAATVPPQTPARYSPPGFASTLMSEFTKLRSVRATYIEIALTIGLALGMTALIGLAIGSTFDELNEVDQATFDPVFASFFGTAFSGIVVVVLGTTFGSSEYTSGMIRQTLTTTPRRGRVLIAKALVVTAITLVLGLIVAFGCFIVGQAVLGAYEGVPTAKFGDDNVLEAVLGAWLTTPFFPLIGLALGILWRNTAGAITTVLSIIFIPGIFGPLLPDTLEENVLKYLPGNASDHLIQATPNKEALTYLEPGAAIALIVVWLAVFLGAAYLSLIRRDVQ